MEGEILRIWAVIDGFTGEILGEYEDRKLASSALRYRYDKANGDHIRAGYVYERSDYGSPIYWTKKELRECEVIR